MLERTSDRWVSITLSVLLHGTLVALLVYGFVTYHKSQPPAATLAIEGIVVDSRSLRGAAVKPPPAPEPPAPAPPTPAPQPPEPVDTTGPPEPTPEELAQREQALKDQAQKEQEQKDQARKEQVQKEQAVKEQAAKDQAQKEQAAREQAEHAAQEKQEAQRLADEKRKAQEKADAERKAAEAKRLADQKRAQEAQRAADDQARQESEAELRNSMAAEEHANQLRSSGALATWSAQITARITRAWLRPPSARQGIECVLHISQAPGGQVLSAKVESCNGDQAVRESIEAAAYRASPLPPPPDPSLFERELEVTFRPN